VPKTISAALAQHLAGEVTRLATCWQVTRRDGVVLRSPSRARGPDHGLGFRYSGHNQVPTLDPRETAHVQVSVDFPSSPTDHAIVAVYTTLDDASEVWDLIPMMEFLIENTRTASASW
jgi:hypothetical protein